MIVDRLIAPRSELGFVRAVDAETVSTTLGAVLRLGAVKDSGCIRGAGLAAHPTDAHRERPSTVICATARWCSTTSARRISKAVAVNWHSTATDTIIAVTGHRSSTGCCASDPVYRLRSRYSKATLPIHQRPASRSASSSGVLASAAWCWSVTVACSPRRGSTRHA